MKITVVHLRQRRWHHKRDIKISLILFYNILQQVNVKCKCKPVKRNILNSTVQSFWQTRPQCKEIAHVEYPFSIKGKKYLSHKTHIKFHLRSLCKLEV